MLRTSHFSVAVLVAALLTGPAWTSSTLVAQGASDGKKGEIRGRFVDASDHAIADLTVMLGVCAKDPDGSNTFFRVQIDGRWATARTDQHGRFVFAAASLGKYCLRTQQGSSLSSVQVKTPAGEVLVFELGASRKVDLGAIAVNP